MSAIDASLSGSPAGLLAIGVVARPAEVEVRTPCAVAIGQGDVVTVGVRPEGCQARGLPITAVGVDVPEASLVRSVTEPAGGEPSTAHVCERVTASWLAVDNLSSELDEAGLVSEPIGVEAGPRVISNPAVPD